MIIIKESIAAVLPETAVKVALNRKKFKTGLVLVAIVFVRFHDENGR